MASCKTLTTLWQIEDLPGSILLVLNAIGEVDHSVRDRSLPVAHIVVHTKTVHAQDVQIIEE